MFGFIAHNIELYKLALIHKSASVVLEDGTHINNERLEYLGDAVIESVTSEYLFIEFPDKNEGFMTQLRSKMVSRQTLNDVAKRIGLDDYVITHSSNNLSQKHIYGDAFEAMIGAIYLDQGYDFVNRLLINHIFVKYIKVDNLLVEETDFKSRLIEWCQKNHHSIQFHTANDKTYSSSHPFFYSKVLIDGIEVGYGAGDSKKEAEQRASYSVSQGFSEADYTKIMDKLDTLDGATKPRERREREPKVVKSTNEVKEVNEIKEVKEEPKVKTKSKTAAKTEQKTEPKPELKSESKPEPKVEQKTEQKSESEAEIKVEAKAEKKPRRRRPSKGVAEKSQKESAAPKEQELSVAEKPQEESATSTEAVVESVPAEDTPKAKPKSRRRATPKKPKAEGVVTEQKVENQEAV
jgi:ribonuclease-3